MLKTMSHNEKQLLRNIFSDAPVTFIKARQAECGPVAGSKGVLTWERRLVDPGRVEGSGAGQGQDVIYTQVRLVNTHAR